jgi:hypothetical protein
MWVWVRVEKAFPPLLTASFNVEVASVYVASVQTREKQFCSKTVVVRSIIDKGLTCSQMLHTFLLSCRIAGLSEPSACQGQTWNVGGLLQ